MASQVRVMQRVEAGAVALAVLVAVVVVFPECGVLACAWAFHVGVDRALGYGLKLPDSFRSTHLGRIGGKAEQP
jgi:hypothetical protein